MSFETAIISRFRTRLGEIKANSEETILSGRCADIEAYRYASGYLKALTDALTIAEEIVREIQGET